MIDLEKYKSVTIKEYYTSHTKPLCVLGVLLTMKGTLIKEEMLSWLTTEYDVITVEQTPPGELYEFPAISYAVDLAKTKNEVVLYIHTKGAAYTRWTETPIRNMWKNEFIVHKQDYNKLIAEHKEEAAVFCPITGPDKNTWFNGFYITPEAAIKTQVLTYNSHRWYWESMYRKNNAVKVIGRLINDIKDVNDEENIQRLLRYISNYR